MTEPKKIGTKTLKKTIQVLESGKAIRHDSLTLVPLTGGEGGRCLEYILSAEAISAGALTVTEVDESGSVPELLAANAGQELVLLVDGEELVGAKQNRILNTSLLLRPRSETKIPVSCVEQGRWHRASRGFGSGSHSPSWLRARKSRDVGRNLRTSGQARSDQRAVWEEVANRIEDLEVHSPTMAMHDVIEQRSESISHYAEALPYPRNARGVIVAINGRFVAADIFDRPETLERIWPRLITAYAVDALGRDKDKPERFTEKAASVLLEHVGEVECQPCPSVGLGEDWRFEADDIVGQALMTKRVCVHLSVFPNKNGHGRQQTGSARVAPPSQRRRRRRGTDVDR